MAASAASAAPVSKATESSAAQVPLSIFYASQTGTAQEFAERCARQARRRGFAATVGPLCDAAVHAFPSLRYAVFFVSSTGDGEMPDHARGWWRFMLRRDLPATALAQLRFGVFGLGDSSYTRFNAAARKVAARLPQLGAQALCERGLGDEQRQPSGLDGDYEAWCATALWPALSAARRHLLPSAAALAAARRGLSPDADLPQPALPGRLACRYSVEVLPAGAVDAADCSSAPSAAAPLHDEAVPPLPVQYAGAGAEVHRCPLTGDSGPWLARVDRNERMTAEGWSQDVRLLRLALPLQPQRDGDAVAAATAHCSGRSPLPAAASASVIRGPAAPVMYRAGPAAPVMYRAGDVAVVYPRNEGTPAAEAAVAAFAAHVGLPLHARLRISLREKSGAGGSGGVGSGMDVEPPPPPAGAAAGAVAAPAAADCEHGEDEEEPDGPPLLRAGDAPLELTLGALLRCVLDVQGVPRRSFLERAAVYASDAEQREKLLEMSGFTPTPDGSGAALYADYCRREARSAAEVLQEFSSVRLPLPVLLELLPALAPRHFSIASAAVTPAGQPAVIAAGCSAASSAGGAGEGEGARAAAVTAASAASAAPASEQVLELAVGLVAYATPLRRRKVGVCSGFLASLRPGSRVFVQVRRGTFSPTWPLPALPATTAAPEPAAARGALAAGLRAGLSVPLLLVGPGTGIAPMRALWQERAAALRLLRSLAEADGSAGDGADDAAAAATAPSFSPAPCHLFYGCRNAAKDWLFGDEAAAAAAAAPGGTTASAAAAAAAATAGGAAFSPLSSYDCAFSRPAKPPRPAAVAAASATTAVTVAAPAASVAAGAGAVLATARHLCFTHAAPDGGADAEVAAAAALAEANATGPLAALPPPVTYVTHRLAARRAEVAAMLLPPQSAAPASTAAAAGTGAAPVQPQPPQPPLVFISGSAKRMPADVAAAMREALAAPAADGGGGLSEAAAAALLTGLERTRRLVTEAWS